MGLNKHILHMYCTFIAHISEGCEVAWTAAFARRLKMEVKDPYFSNKFKGLEMLPFAYGV